MSWLCFNRDDGASCVLEVYGVLAAYASCVSLFCVCVLAALGACDGDDGSERDGRGRRTQARKPATIRLWQPVSGCRYVFARSAEVWK